MNRISRWIAGLLVALLTFGLVAPLLAVAGVQDPAPFSAVAALLTGLAPIFETLLVSGITWVANTGSGWIRDWENWKKYALMGVIGVLVSVASVALFGYQMPQDATAWTAVTAAGLAKAAVAAIIFKLGKRAATPKPL